MSVPAELGDLAPNPLLGVGCRSGSEKAKVERWGFGHCWAVGFCPPHPHPQLGTRRGLAEREGPAPAW